MVSLGDIKNEPNSNSDIESGINYDIIMQKFYKLESRIEKLEKGFKTVEEPNFKGKKTAFSVRIPEELYNKLKDLKETYGTTLNKLILKAIALLITNSEGEK